MGDGGEVTEVFKDIDGNITGILTDCNIDLTDYITDEDSIFEVTITQTCDIHGNSIEPSVETYKCIPVIDKDGFCSEFLFTDYINSEVVPSVGDIVSFGLEGKSYTECIVFGKKNNGDGTFDLTVTPYQAGIYNKDSDEIPEFDSKVTLRNNNEGYSPKPATVLDIDEKTQGFSDALALAVARVSEVEEEIKNLADNPVITTDISSIGIAVNDDDIATMTQEVRVTVSARQGEEKLAFYFGNIDFPEGYSYVLDGDAIVIKIAEGTLVTTQALTIPIIFTAYEYNFDYENESGENYAVDNKGEDVYGVREGKKYESLYEVGFTCIGVQGGRYKGSVVHITKDKIYHNYEKDEEGKPVINPDTEQPVWIDSEDVSTLILGDYFTYGYTEEQPSGLIKDDDSFKPSSLYAFVGVSNTRKYLFETEKMSEHVGGTLADVLAVSNEHLEQNNSTVYQFLDHLTANSIFVDKLVANSIIAHNIMAQEAVINSLFASNAFIDNLSSSKIELKKDGVIQSEDYVSGKSKGFILRSDGTFELAGGTFYGNIESGALILIQSEETSASIDTINNQITTYDIYSNPDWIKGKKYAVSGVINNDVISDFMYVVDIFPKKNTNYKTIGYKWQSWTGTDQKRYNGYPLLEYTTYTKFLIRYTCESGEKEIELSIACYYRDYASSTVVRSNYDSDERNGLIVNDRDVYTTYYDDGVIITDRINISRTSSNKVMRFNDLPTQDDIYSTTPKGTVYVDTKNSNTIKIVN